MKKLKEIMVDIVTIFSRAFIDMLLVLFIPTSLGLITSEMTVYFPLSLCVLSGIIGVGYVMVSSKRRSLYRLRRELKSNVKNQIKRHEYGEK